MVTGNGPTKLSKVLLAMDVAIKNPQRSPVIRLSVVLTFWLYFSPVLSVNASCKNGVNVGPGQNIVTSICGFSTFKLA